MPNKVIQYDTLPSSISYSLSTIPPVAPIPCLLFPCPSFSLSFIPPVPPIPGLHVLSLRSILNPAYYSSNSSNSLLLSYNYPLLFPVFFPSIPPYYLPLLSPSLISLSTIPLVPHIPCIQSYQSLLFPVTILPVSFYYLSTIFPFPVIILPVLKPKNDVSTLQTYTYYSKLYT